LETEPDPLPTLLFSTHHLLLSVNFFDALGYIGVILVLLSCSALAASSEVAYFSLSYTELRALEDEKTASGRRILRLVNAPRNLLATILIVNNFVNICIVVVSDYILHKITPPGSYQGWAAFMDRYLPFLHMQAEAWERSIRFSINVVGVTFLIVLFGEVTPKIYARLNKIALVRFMARPLTFLAILCAPFSYALVHGAKLIERRLAGRGISGADMTSQDLDKAIDLTVLHDQEAGKEVDLLKRIVKFGEVAVKQVMCPRTDVVGVDFRTPFKKLLAIVKESGFSRLPVYDEDFDNVTGILYGKDLINYFDESEDGRF